MRILEGTVRCRLGLGLVRGCVCSTCTASDAPTSRSSQVCTRSVRGAGERRCIPDGAKPPTAEHFAYIATPPAAAGPSRRGQLGSARGDRPRQPEADGFLVGRSTFEDLRGYWPQKSDDATGVTEYLNQVQKYLVSATMTEPGWQNSTILSGDPVEEVRAIKQKPGRDIVVIGSITLCHALIQAGLVDQYRLFVYPVMQSRGRRLFPDGFTVPHLRLLDAKVFRSGITYSRYTPARS